MSSIQGVPTARAFWELQADQLLNRVFEAETAIEVEVLDRPPRPPAESPAPSAPPSPHPQAAAIPRQRSRRLPRRWPAWSGSKPSLILAAIGATGLVVSGSGLLLIGLWNQSQQSLRQERNLILLERLRQLGPAAAALSPPDAASTTPAARPTAGTSSSEGLPPPPPHEPWMQELASLPRGAAPAAEPLRVPVTQGIASPPPAAGGGGGGGGGTRSAAASPNGGAAPQLVGVVQVPGRSGSAIFQVGASSTSAVVGESIGGSGWRLVSASGDSAVIERGGEQRRLSISGGF